MQGTVIKSTGSWYIVKTEEGQLLNCRIRGKFRMQDIKSTNPIVVGDKVLLSQEEESFLIDELYDRKNIIVRKSVNLSKQTHIIASNIDQAILMVSMKSPLTSTGFIDRFLVSAQAYGVEVVIFFNKVDLYDEPILVQLEERRSVYEKIGYRCFTKSILNDDLSDVKAFMKGKVNVISGHSGVGKSTLLNKIQPDLNIHTQEVSEQHQQGQHTTTFSEMHDLEFGASIIDTPGVRGFGLIEMDKYELGDYFIEFFKLKSECKFNNCLHINEPNCAIKLALENGEIAASRYKNYLSMLEQDDESFRVNRYEQ
ncbi:MAG: ribosome small subunit-dependent GTPase A [Flavobacteriales bacterium]|nr:ribosome small subunit-dependent GTPase A [Flavobacteriales bacterium]MBL6873476.1 ribosome small subunit-dependent GTPase A [Flavobacteriales bacterium]